VKFVDTADTAVADASGAVEDVTFAVEPKFVTRSREPSPLSRESLLG
jgi:hypothetical protein